MCESRRQQHAVPSIALVFSHCNVSVNDFVCSPKTINSNIWQETGPSVWSAFHATCHQIILVLAMNMSHFILECGKHVIKIASYDWSLLFCIFFINWDGPLLGGRGQLNGLIQQIDDAIWDSNKSRISQSWWQPTSDTVCTLPTVLWCWISGLIWRTCIEPVIEWVSMCRSGPSSLHPSHSITIFLDILTLDSHYSNRIDSNQSKLNL